MPTKPDPIPRPSRPLSSEDLVVVVSSLVILLVMILGILKLVGEFQ